MSTIGHRIRAIRKEKGLTLDDLAKLTRMSKSFLWAVENDSSDIGGKNLVVLATQLGASLDFLLTGVTPRGTQATIEVPPELIDFAEKKGLSFAETHDLLRAQTSVLARRSNKPDERMTYEGWEKLWNGIKDIIRNERD